MRFKCCHQINPSCYLAALAGRKQRMGLIYGATCLTGGRRGRRGRGVCSRVDGGWGVEREREKSPNPPGSCGQFTTFCWVIFFAENPLIRKNKWSVPKLNFFRKPFQNYWVFVQKDSLTAYLWQLRYWQNTINLKVSLCFYTFRGLLNRMETKSKSGSFLTISCDPALNRPTNVVVSTNQNYHYFLRRSLWT